MGLASVVRTYKYGGYKIMDHNYYFFFFFWVRTTIIVVHTCKKKIKNYAPNTTIFMIMEPCEAF